MFARRFLGMKKAQDGKAREESIKILNIDYAASSKCKKGRCQEDTCLKCGKCGRIFDAFGMCIKK